MDLQEIEAMEIMLSRFLEERNHLKKVLDALTTDGDGVLYRLKQAVGADSQLGATISNVGGAVMSARTNAIVALDQIAEIIKQKIAEAKSYNAEAEAGLTQINTKINNITFE